MPSQGTTSGKEIHPDDNRLEKILRISETDSKCELLTAEKSLF